MDIIQPDYLWLFSVALVSLTAYHLGFELIKRVEQRMTVGLAYAILMAITAVLILGTATVFFLLFRNFPYRPDVFINAIFGE